jgi:twinkle protein
VLGGWRDGEFTVVTGDTGSGKSTWTTDAAYNQLTQGNAVLLAPFEQKPWEVVSKLVSVDAEKSVFDMREDELDEAVTRVSRLPLFILDRHGPTPLAEIRDAIFTSVYRYGIKFVIIDHLHYFLDSDPGNERYAIDEAVRAFKLWSQDLQIHIMLVVHPAKLGRDGKGNVRKVQLDDLKGSSEIKKEADNGIRIHKQRDEFEECDKSEVEILKCRSNAGREGRVWFYFDVKSERYIEGAMPPAKRGRRKTARQTTCGRDAAAGPDDDRYDDAF